MDMVNYVDNYYLETIWIL